MDQKTLVLNWKSNKTPLEAKSFLEKIPDNFDPSCKMILCPDFLSIPVCSEVIKNKKINISLGAQDISRFGKGAYTGEVSGSALSEFVEYVIIGHAERRLLFNETEEIIKEKVLQAKKNNLKVILCVENAHQLDGVGGDIVAYEPVSSIGTGKVEEASKIESVFQELKNYTSSSLLYGGSVNYNELSDLKEVKNLSGFLLGSASLDVENVLNIAKSL